ncbi:hypothetical protein ACU686_03645 [Yinghuangia aomiensis]
MDSFLAVRPDVDVVLVDLKLAGTGRVPARQGPYAVEAVAAAGYRSSRLHQRAPPPPSWPIAWREARAASSTRRSR